MSEKALHHGCVERMKEFQSERDNWKAEAEDKNALYRAEKAENARLRKALEGMLNCISEDAAIILVSREEFASAIAAAREALK